MNVAILTGYAGTDAEKIGDVGARFRMATTEVYFKDKEKHERTDWHTIVCFGSASKYALLAVKKGSFVQVRGKIENRTFDKKDGTKGYDNRIVVSGYDSEISAHAVDKTARKGTKEPTHEPANPFGGNDGDDLNDDVPF